MKGMKLQLFGLALLVFSLIRLETISLGQFLLCLFGLMLSLAGLMLRDT